jgi:probable rRNA maturation factor
VRACFTLERSKAKGELAIVIVSRARMLQLNKMYLGHDWDTDVISFTHDMVAGIPPGDLPFGDVYISAYLARKQAAEHGHSVRREALTLAAHGTLHLLGHDDSSAALKARMFRRQEQVLAALGQ